MMKVLNFVSQLKKLLRAQSGIGLVETLVAVAILGVSAVSFVSNLSVGAMSVRTLNEEATIQQLLTTQMETLKGLKYDATGNTYPVISTPDGYNLTLSVDSQIVSNTNLQKITATLWLKGKQVAILENYKANR
jgi:Tfp pilus assembly protein PilV